jgi:hypothetical protein
LGRQTAYTVKLTLDGSELAMATRQPVRPPAKVLGTVELMFTSVAAEFETAPPPVTTVWAGQTAACEFTDSGLTDAAALWTTL